MPVKSRATTMVAEAKRPARKPKRDTGANSVPERNPAVSEMLEQIRVRGDQLSAEIKQLLVRLG